MFANAGLCLPQSMSVPNPFAEKKTGFLVKQSKDKIRKTWNKRYFELEWPHLRYKKDPAEAEWRGGPQAHSPPARPRAAHPAVRGPFCLDLEPQQPPYVPLICSAALRPADDAAVMLAPRRLMIM